MFDRLMTGGELKERNLKCRCPREVKEIVMINRCKMYNLIYFALVFGYVESSLSAGTVSDMHSHGQRHGAQSRS